jgi:photosynthetic reaction center H subunit
MQNGSSYFDVAQVAVYVFWLFLAGLIYYLRSEDKREGYPLESDRSPNIRVEGFPPMPKPKRFILPHGGIQTAPRAEVAPPVNGRSVGGFPGAPLEPIGDPMLSGMGPGAYAHRADEPDLMFGTNEPRIVPLSADIAFSLASEDPDPRGMVVVAADGKSAGTVVDAWVDRSEMIVRYLEIALPGAGAPHVLVPMTMAVIDGKRNRVAVDAILADQFANVPRLRLPDRITLLEEDKISAYYAGGSLYAKPSRLGPLL